MSNAISLARPYARAAFELAQAHAALGEWAGKLGFAAEIAADPRVTALFGDPRLAENDLIALVLPPGEAADSPFTRFVHVLADNGRLPVLPEVGALFEELRQEAERTLTVNVRSATPIDAGEVAKLKDALKRRFGRDIELHQTIDRGVLGGAIVDAGNVVIDGSVRGRLARLEQALTQ